MKISELTTLDVKKVDFAQLQDSLLKRQDIVVNGLLIIASLFFMVQTFTGKQKEAEQLKTKITDLEKKIEVIELNTKATNNFKKFFDELPKGMSEDAIIDRLTDFAEKRNIRITSVSPAKSENKDIYARTTVNIIISAGSYKDLCLFLYDIENSLDSNLRIDKWSGTLAQQSEREKKETIVAEVEISSIQFKKT